MIYALLIQTSAAPLGESQKSLLERHRALQAESKDKGQLLASARLEGKATAKTVRVASESFDLTDGPFMESKEWLVGFYLVDCADEATAVARAQQICPKNGSVEVRPVKWHYEA